jgi:hypothetical protein
VPRKEKGIQSNSIGIFFVIRSVLELFFGNLWSWLGLIERFCDTFNKNTLNHHAVGNLAVKSYFLARRKNKKFKFLFFHQRPIKKNTYVLGCALAYACPFFYPAEVRNFLLILIPLKLRIFFLNWACLKSAEPKVIWRFICTLVYSSTDLSHAQLRPLKNEFRLLPFTNTNRSQN